MLRTDIYFSVSMSRAREGGNRNDVQAEEKRYYQAVLKRLCRNLKIPPPAIDSEKDIIIIANPSCEFEMSLVMLSSLNIDPPPPRPPSCYRFFGAS